MKLHIHSNKFLIYGADASHIESDTEGILAIGASSIQLVPGIPTVVSLLVDGTYKPRFKDKSGVVYEGAVTIVRNGKIVLPSKETIELFELRCRYEELQSKMAEKFESIDKEIKELKGIFDTNSLNFII